MHLKLICSVALFCAVLAAPTDNDDEETRAKAYMDELNEEFLTRRNTETNASWDYASNITDTNLKRRNEISTVNAEFAKTVAKKINTFNWRDFKDTDLKRKFKKLSKLDYAALPEAKYKELLDAISSMQSNYAKVKICDYKQKAKCDLALEPELTEILISSRDPEELKYYWLEWYNKAGAPTKEDFKKYVALNKEAALLNGFKSGAEAWLDEYEDDTFEQQIDTVIGQLLPLYKQLHAYVRHKLQQKYGQSVVPSKGPIPMHLVGNMWAQTWDMIADFTTPFPDKKLLDVTDEMVKQGYTPVKMFQMGDEFFQSLNMTKLPGTFWEKSILEKPTDGRELVCHASAWDFFKNNDVRIKQCTRVTMDQLLTAHHELGHIQYYLQYQHLPSVYREGANPGFHEAVGDVLSLSVSTPKHLQKIGLLKDYVADEEAKINQVYRNGLEKLIFFPFAYVLDKYRWGIFRDEIKETEFNCKFWQMREQFCGVTPPVARTEADFDAPAKYHVSADVEYLRYFVSFVIQFQFHKAACLKAGEYVPGDPVKTLNDCDIYQSTEAGNAFKEMLALGSSKPWPDAMEVLTGTRTVDAGAFLEYFKPLEDWLKQENEKNGVHIGWEPTGNYKC